MEYWDGKKDKNFDLERIEILALFLIFLNFLTPVNFEGSVYV